MTKRPHRHCTCPYSLQWAAPSPLIIALSQVVSGPHLNPRSHMSPQPKWHLNWFISFCRAPNHDRPTRQPTDRPRYSTCNNGPHLRSTAMQPNNTMTIYRHSNVLEATIVSITQSCPWNHRHHQWRSRTLGRLVRWSNLPPYCLRFWKWIACLKPRVLMPKVTCSIYSILVSS